MMVIPDQPLNPPAQSEVPVGFEVLEELGRGGMGRVLRVRRGGVEYALKQMLDSRDVELRARFEREARLLAEVSTCPTIVTVHAWFEEPLPSILMEMVEGRTLADHFRDGPMPVESVRRVACDLAEALAAMHERGLVHRDVKPDNTVISAEDGRLRLMDFGLAEGGRQERLTMTGCLLGTPQWMAPEQLNGERVGPAADVWAFGALLFQALTGQPAFDGDSISALRADILFGSPASLTRLRPDTPSDLQRLVEACLAKSPEDRPANGAALVAVLAGTRALSRRPRRGLRRAVVIGLPLLALAVMVVGLIAARDPEVEALRRRLVTLDQRLRRELAEPNRESTERLESLLIPALEPSFSGVLESDAAPSPPSPPSRTGVPRAGSGERAAEREALFRRLERSDIDGIPSETRERLLDARARLAARAARRRSLAELETRVRGAVELRPAATTLALLDELVELRRGLAKESSSARWSAAESEVDEELESFEQAVELSRALVRGDLEGAKGLAEDRGRLPVSGDALRLLVRFHRVYRVAGSEPSRLGRLAFQPLPKGLPGRMQAEAARLWRRFLLWRADPGSTAVATDDEARERALEASRVIAALLAAKLGKTPFEVRLSELAAASEDKARAARILQSLATAWIAEARDAWRRGGGGQPMLASLPAFRRAFDALVEARRRSPEVRLPATFPTVVLEAFAVNLRGLAATSRERDAETFDLTVEAGRLGRFMNMLAKSDAWHHVVARFPKPEASVEARYWNAFVAGREQGEDHRARSRRESYRWQLELLGPVLESVEGQLLEEATTWEANALEELWDDDKEGRAALRGRLRDCYERLSAIDLERTSRPDEVCWYRYKLARCLGLPREVRVEHLTTGKRKTMERTRYTDQSGAVDSYNPWLSSVSRGSSRLHRIEESLAELQDSRGSGE